MNGLTSSGIDSDILVSCTGCIGSTKSLSATRDPNSPLPASPGSAAALPEEAEVVVEQDPDLYADTEPLEYVTV